MSLSQFQWRLLYDANLTSSAALKASDAALARIMAPRSKAGRSKGAK